MDNQTKYQIRDFVSKARLSEALSAFELWANEKGSGDLQNQIRLKKGEFKKLKSDENLGLLNNSDARTQRNQMANAILSMLDDAEDAAPEPSKVVVPTMIVGYGPTNSGTILFLAANPMDTAKLQLEKEFIQVLKNLDDKPVSYTLKSEFAVTPSLLQTALLKYRPRIVHFSGHGDGGDSTSANDDTRAIGKIPGNRSGIVLQTLDGKTQLVSGAALANLFKVCLRIFKLEVVLLNACSSEEQASAIFNAGVPFVIGMNMAVKDSAAIQFSSKFYEGLASEGDVEIAFELAKAGVMMENGFSNDADIPVLYKKEA